MNTRKTEANRTKTAAKVETKTKTGEGGKVGGLDADLGWATNLLAGRRFDNYVDSEGGSAEENFPGQYKS